MPYSYKYYDPILSLIKNELPPDQKKLFGIQRKLIIERIFNDDFKQKFFEKIGIRNPLDEQQNTLYLKQSVVNKDDK